MAAKRRKTSRVQEKRKGWQRLVGEGCGRMLFEIHKIVERRNARRIYSCRYNLCCNIVTSYSRVKDMVEPSKINIRSGRGDDVSYC